MESRRMGMFAGGAMLVVAAAVMGASRIMAQDGPPPGPGYAPGQTMPQQPMLMQRPMGGVAMTALNGNIYVLQGARLFKIEASSMRVTGEAELPQLRGGMNPGNPGPGIAPRRNQNQNQGGRRNGGQNLPGGE